MDAPTERPTIKATRVELPGRVFDGRTEARLLSGVDRRSQSQDNSKLVDEDANQWHANCTYATMQNALSLVAIYTWRYNNSRHECVCVCVCVKYGNWRTDCDATTVLLSLRVGWSIVNRIQPVTDRHQRPQTVGLGETQRAQSKPFNSMRLMLFGHIRIP